MEESVFNLLFSPVFLPLPEDVKLPVYHFPKFYSFPKMCNEMCRNVLCTGDERRREIGVKYVQVQNNHHSNLRMKSCPRKAKGLL